MLQCVDLKHFDETKVKTPEAYILTRCCSKAAILFFDAKVGDVLAQMKLRRSRADANVAISS